MRNEFAEARQARLAAAERLIEKYPAAEQIAPKKPKAVRRTVTPPMELRVEVAKVS